MDNKKKLTRTHEAKERKYVEGKLVKELKKMGVFNCKGNPKQLRGFPDRMVFINQKIIFVECKAGAEFGSYYRQTELQKRWQKQIEASGCEYKIVEGTSGVKTFIEELKKEIEFYGKTYCF